MTDNPTPSKLDELAFTNDIEAKLKTIHNRFHGRYHTHAEVAKRSHWTTDELTDVQIQDEWLMYKEIHKLYTQLFTQHYISKDQAARDVVEGIEQYKTALLAQLKQPEENYVRARMNVIDSEQSQKQEETE